MKKSEENERIHLKLMQSTLSCHGCKGRVSGICTHTNRSKSHHIKLPLDSFLSSSAQSERERGGRHTERVRDRQTDRDGRQTERERGETKREMGDRKREMAEREACRQTDKLTDRQTDGQTDRWRENLQFWLAWL